MWGSGKKKRGSSSGSGGPSSSSSSSAASASAAARTAMFSKYASADDPFSLDMDCLGSFFDDLGMDPTEDVRCLVLMWRMGAEAKPGEISQAEWGKGCEKLDVEDLEGFKKLLPSLDTGFLSGSDFSKFYKFCFQFSREGTHKTIEKDLVVALLQIVLEGRGNVHLAPFCSFLESTGDENNRVSLDSWLNFLTFSEDISEGCEEYDLDEGAWPVLIDEYVEWVRKKK
mmetsp:Transcript_27380/g.54680  ORF Transcript_27380/g.54680 Transcript_27380/m.54680 type:complete len:227 (+) Transcript_27380:174-854(+)